jgi:LuxR family maltose regulon positive regulatory protein
MARPMIATKLYVPALRRGLVARPRLRARLRDAAESRLTLVSAPAGFGKTTMVADWLRGSPDDARAVAWLSLDASDRDPASFWAGVMVALQGALPDLAPGALELLASSTAPTELMLTTLLNELALTPGEVWLVLDDVHLVDGPAVRDGLVFLVEHLPPGVHLVLTTRADPDLPLARWRARGDLTEIRAADLRFTADEAATYLTETTGLHLDPRDVELLEERTEGWIAALQLAALSMRGDDDVSGFVARFAGTDRFVVDYLVEEVLLHQSDAVRSFLVQTSVLDRLTGPLCDAVTGRDDGATALRELERANLFLVPLDDERRWYRYHHLFADVLRARLMADQPELVSRLHERASVWCELHELPEDAVRHALAAGNLERAAHLMELAMPAIRRDRRESLLPGWLASLPDEVIARSPVLSVFHAYLRMMAGDLDGFAARLDDAERVLAALPEGAPAPGADTEELRTLPATIAVYRASLAQAHGDVAGTVRHAQHALDLAGPDDHLARGSAAGFLGLAAWARGDVMPALETFAQAVASLHAAGNIVDELSATTLLAEMWVVAGRPTVARRLLDRALQRAEAGGPAMARAIADLHVGLSEVDLDAHDVVAARAHLERAAVFVEQGALVESRSRWFVARARLAAAESDPEAAVRLLDEAEEHYRPGFYPEVRPIDTLRARVWIDAGALSEAAAWATERGLSTSDEVSYLRELDHLTLVRLVLARHRIHPDESAVDEAAGLLGRLLEAAESTGRMGSAAEIRQLLQLTSLAREAGETTDARAHASGDLPTVGPAEPSTAPQTPPVRAVLTEPLTQPLTQPLTEPLTERELQVLRLLEGDLTGPQIARELFVSTNTLRSHTKHIFTKLGVTSRRAAVRRARVCGLL